MYHDFSIFPIKNISFTADIKLNFNTKNIMAIKIDIFAILKMYIRNLALNKYIKNPLLRIASAP